MTTRPTLTLDNVPEYLDWALTHQRSMTRGELEHHLTARGARRAAEDGRSAEQGNATHARRARNYRPSPRPPPGRVML